MERMCRWGEMVGYTLASGWCGRVYVEGVGIVPRRFDR
jgi:hypothetical protein